MEEPEDEFTSDDTNFEPDESSVAVAPNPAMNGTSQFSRQTVARMPSGEMINKKVTESYTVPINSNNLMGRINNRPTYAPEKVREKDDREFLDAFNIKADAAKYQLACVRILPSTNASGEPVPTGVASKHVFPCMSYDELVSSIQDIWGGGSYRVSFVEESGRLADNIARCILVNIPTTQYPAKREKNEVVEMTRTLKQTATTTVPGDEATQEMITARNEYKMREEEMRRREKYDEMSARETEREYKKLKREKELNELRKQLMDNGEGKKSTEIELLEKRLDEERRSREAAELRREVERKEERDRQEKRDEEARRREEENRKFMMEGMMRLGESIKEVANRPVQKDDTLEKLLAVMAPVITAVVSRPTLPPPDNTPLILEMNKIQAANQQASMQMLATISAKPADNGNKEMLEAIIKVGGKQDATNQAMISGMMQALLEKDKGHVLTPETMMDIQERAEKRMERMIGLGTGGRGPDGEGDGDDGYDPSLGFLGNAGKALFGSLKALMDSAATNPALMNLAAQLIGSRNPTDRQLVQVAQQLERSGGIPPALMHQNQPALPEFSSYAQQQVPYPQAPMQNQGMIQNQNPPPIGYQQPVAQQQQQANPAYAQPPQQAVNTSQQQSVANELEGTASGLPSNGEPDIQAPTPEQLADENLIDAVTRTVEIMTAEASGKPAKRTWPEHATDNWNRDFIQRIVACPDMRTRMQLIATKCDPQAVQNFNMAIRTDVAEQEMFKNELTRFVAMNTPRQSPAPVVTSPVQAPPQVAQSMPPANLI